VKSKHKVNDLPRAGGGAKYLALLHIAVEAGKSGRSNAEFMQGGCGKLRGRPRKACSGGTGLSFLPARFGSAHAGGGRVIIQGRVHRWEHESLRKGDTLS
jgi:hypothetical protein